MICPWKSLCQCNPFILCCRSLVKPA